MLEKGLRAFGWAAYAVVVVAAFVLAGYFSFNLFVRSGVTTVPDLLGIPAGQVSNRLTDAGLRVQREVAGDRFDETVAADHVLQQNPGPGSLVKRGSAVEVTLSLGPERVPVPDLTGSSLQTAQVTLGAAGLKVGRTATVYRSGALPGTVVEQDPGPGELVGRAAAVALYLCLESGTDTYLMPDLTYRNLEVVRHYFERRGFRLGSVKFETYEGISPGVVLRQFPPPGHPLRRRDVISLVVTTHEGMGV